MNTVNTVTLCRVVVFDLPTRIRITYSKVLSLISVRKSNLYFICQLIAKSSIHLTNGAKCPGLGREYPGTNCPSKKCRNTNGCTLQQPMSPPPAPSPFRKSCISLLFKNMSQLPEKTYQPCTGLQRFLHFLLKGSVDLFLLIFFSTCN